MHSHVISCALCPDYDGDNVYQAIKNAVELLFPEGLGTLVKPGNSVALKVNMLMGKAPEKAVTTHPAVVSAVVRLVLECGGKPLIIDSPGGPYTPTTLKLAYERCGFADVARESGAVLNYDTDVVRVSSASGIRVMSAELLNPAVEADIIINLPKLKTHGLTTLTCAVKNMFGLIPGMTKIEYHMRSPEVSDFCGMLVDIAELASPELTIVDAITAMQGEGPSGGKSKDMQLVLVGQNMHSLDYFAASLMEIPLEQVDTIDQAQKHGLSPMSLDQIELRGHRPVPSRFVLPTASTRTNILDHFIPKAMADRVAHSLRPRPVFTSSCNACGVCVRSCPPQALAQEKGEPPTLKTSACIRCFCCQELCPQHAIEVRSSWLGRMLFR